LKLTCAELVSTVAFNFNLRPFSKELLDEWLEERLDHLGRSGLPGFACHVIVIGYNLIQETRVHNVLDDVAVKGPGRCFSPRHGMTFDSKNEGSKCVSMTW
jgi:hypothetical protein